MNPVPLEDFLETYRKRAHLTDPIKTRYLAHVDPGTATTRRLSTAIASAERRPQVVFKVLSKLAGATGIQKALDYISRDGALELEMANEEYLNDKTDTAALIDDWRHTFAMRKNGVDAVHLMLSTPAHTDPDAVLQAARAFCADQFPTHDYVFVRHDDTRNPHVHVLVKQRNAEQECLPWYKADLTHYREAWGHHCNQRGIDAATSYRSERGVYDKGVSMARRRLTDRGEQQEHQEPEAGIPPSLQSQLNKTALEEARFRAYAARMRKPRQQRTEAAADLLEAHADRLKEGALQHLGQYVPQQQPQQHVPQPPRPKSPLPSIDSEPGD